MRSGLRPKFSCLRTTHWKNNLFTPMLSVSHGPLALQHILNDGGNIIVMVDEAHHLRADVLEDLRLLTNYAMDSENRLDFDATMNSVVAGSAICVSATARRNSGRRTISKDICGAPKTRCRHRGCARAGRIHRSRTAPRR